MWVKYLVKFMLVLQFVVSSTQLEENVQETSELESSSLPNIWEDDVVLRMVREVLAQDLMKEHAHKIVKHQHKRDVQVIASSASTPRAHTTHRVSSSTQKAKKPTKVTQTGNKTKNRVTSTASTKATVKPSTKPIVTNINLGVNSVNASKLKVRNN